MVVSDRPLIGLLERALAGDHGVLPDLHAQVASTVFDPTRPAAWLPLAVPVVRRLASHEPLENQSDEEGLEVALRLARQIWQAGPPFGWNLQVVAALERLLDRLTADRPSWQRSMDTLARLGTPEALKAWTERVVERSGVEGDLWSLIWLMSPGQETPHGPLILHHPRAVFPRLLDAMQERELWPLIVRLGNAARGLERHPLANHVDALEEMLRGGLGGRTSLGGYAPALIAVEAMGDLDDQRSFALLQEAAQSDWPDLQVGALVALGKRGDPDARQNLILLTRWPATHVPAVLAIRDMGEMELAEKCASDEDLSFRAKIGNWAARIRFGGHFPDVVETIHTEWIRWPGFPEPVPVMVGHFSTEDPQHLLMDGAGQLVSVNGRLVGPDFGIPKSMSIPDALGLACGIELRNRGRLSEEPISWAEEREMIEQVSTEAAEYTRVQPRFGVRIPNSLTYPRSGRGLLFLNESDGVVISRVHSGNDVGWVVREGPILTWYAESAWPRRTTAEEVIWSHIGRRLLYLEPEESTQYQSLDEMSGPSDDALLKSLDHEEETEPGAPQGWGSLERCLGMATVLGRIACAVAARGDHSSEVEALVTLSRPVRDMLEQPDKCGELLWVDRFIECSLSLVAHGIQAIEGSHAAEYFLRQAATAWTSAECTSGILKASLSIGCPALSHSLADRLDQMEDGWQWPEIVGSVYRQRVASGSLEEVNACIRTHLRNMKSLDRLNRGERTLDFEPLSSLLDLEQVWQGWWELHQELVGSKAPLQPEFYRSVIATP